MWRRFAIKALDLIPVFGRTQSPTNSEASRHLIIRDCSGRYGNAVKVMVSRRRQNLKLSKPSATVCRSSASTKTEASIRTNTQTERIGRCSSGRCGLLPKPAMSDWVTSFLERSRGEKLLSVGSKRPSDSRAAATREGIGST